MGGNCQGPANENKLEQNYCLMVFGKKLIVLILISMNKHLKRMDSDGVCVPGNISMVTCCQCTDNNTSLLFDYNNSLYLTVYETALELELMSVSHFRLV